MPGPGGERGEEEVVSPHPHPHPHRPVARMESRVPTALVS